MEISFISLEAMQTINRKFCMYNKELKKLKIVLFINVVCKFIWKTLHYPS